MDGSKHERRQYFRGKSKPDRVLAIRFKTTLHPGWIAAQMRDIGAGGAFITCDELQPVDTSLTVELTLPTSDEHFTLPAIVRWSRADDGMGVQFVGVDADVLRELTDYFGSL